MKSSFVGVITMVKDLLLPGVFSLIKTILVKLKRNFQNTERTQNTFEALSNQLRNEGFLWLTIFTQETPLTRKRFSGRMHLIELEFGKMLIFEERGKPSPQKC